MRPSRLFSAVLLASAAVTVVTAPAQAQLGRLKKLGADAVKEAVKEKTGVKEPEPAKPAPGKKANYTITPKRLDAFLASIQPLVVKGQKLDAANKAEKDYNAKQKLAQACVDRAEKGASAASVMATMTEENMTRIQATQQRITAMQSRIEAAAAKKDYKAVIALQDTATVMSIGMSTGALGTKCNYPYMPAAMIEVKAEQQLLDENGGSDGKQFEMLPEAKQEMTFDEFVKIFEEVAMYAISQSNPEFKGISPSQMKFTADEQAALSGKSKELKALGPLFAGGFIAWTNFGSIKSW